MKRLPQHRSAHPLRRAGASTAGAGQGSGLSTSPDQPTFIGVIGDPSYSGASGSGSGMRDGLDNAANTVWGSFTESETTSLTAILGSDALIDHIRLLAIPTTFDGWGPQFLNGATVFHRPAAGGAWTSLGLVSGAADGEYVIFPISTTVGEIKVERTGEFLGIADFIVSLDPPPAPTPPSDQARLREDGGYRLREDGSYRLTENP